MAASNAEAKAGVARLADYKSKELQDVTLGKDASAHGFVYFIPPPKTPPFTEATLAVKLVDSENFTSVEVRLPLSGLKFKVAPAAPEKEASSAVSGKR